MLIAGTFHLTYCTNIHPGESWSEIFSQLELHVPYIKKKICPLKPFGVGLRLSDLASRELSEKKNLSEFKSWLKDHDCYVFTMNGFVYGGFHHAVVKDRVHFPDWTTSERFEYTLRMFRILAELLPRGMEGGISTSPLSYRKWHDGAAKNRVCEKASSFLAGIAEALEKIRLKTGKTLHLDIEPEPDGLLENTDEAVAFFTNYLFPQAKKDFPSSKAENIIREHIRICYDICHSAVMYENPGEILKKFSRSGIRIGKIQISSALKVKCPPLNEERKKISDLLKPFAESTYLHQTVQRNADNTFTRYTDLPFALQHISDAGATEWRIHYHVPVFMKSYEGLQSTHEDILEVLTLLKNNPVTYHLETETYTWEVLPENKKLSINDSLAGELLWVKEILSA
jgi:hypothetical protein